MRNILVLGADNSPNFSEQNPKYPDLLKKYGPIFQDAEKFPIDSPQFKQAFNALLHDLVQKTQETGDTKDVSFFVEKSYQAGLVTDAQYIDLTRRIAELQAPRALAKTGDRPSTLDLPVGFHAVSSADGAKKFVNYAPGWGGKGECDVVVSFPKDGDGKGNKTLVSAHSGYAVELVGGFAG